MMMFKWCLTEKNMWFCVFVVNYLWFDLFLVMIFPTNFSKIWVTFLLNGMNKCGFTSTCPEWERSYTFTSNRAKVDWNLTFYQFDSVLYNRLKWVSRMWGEMKRCLHGRRRSSAWSCWLPDQVPPCCFQPSCCVLARIRLHCDGGHITKQPFPAAIVLCGQRGGPINPGWVEGGKEGGSRNLVQICASMAPSWQRNVAEQQNVAFHKES